MTGRTIETRSDHQIIHGADDDQRRDRQWGIEKAWYRYFEPKPLKKKDIDQFYRNSSRLRKLNSSILFVSSEDAETEASTTWWRGSAQTIF
ncbi:hypothetical protein MKZ38_001738 [Zalerion maritima]|uniref:Uncharacterized protein n=1 Tax=Zalerion maritima TaxID=339359 RepID=A0AAD5WTL8_9PEZI|nr:hypothetical protein MKZ38_001738 [Zalerion maritima]